MTATTTEPTTHTLEAPGRHAHLRRPAQRQPRTEPVLLLIGSPMGAARLRHARRPLHRPHGRHLRPARRRAQREGRPCQPVDARAARRRPASDHRGARCGPGRPVRQQRRRGERPGARRNGIRSRSGRSWRTSRRSLRVLPDREHALAAARDVHETYMRSWLGRRDGALHRAWSATRARSRPTGPTSRRRIRRCSGCRPRTTARGPTCCSART